MNDSEQTVKIGFDIAELQVLRLEAGDVLSVKLIGDDFDQATAESLQQHLAKLFPNNKVSIFTMPNGSDILFQAIKQPQPEGN